MIGPHVWCRATKEVRALPLPTTRGGAQLCLIGILPPTHYVVINHNANHTRFSQNSGGTFNHIQEPATHARVCPVES